MRKTKFAMSLFAFDALAYFEKPKALGAPGNQAKIQADSSRDFSVMQTENAKKELATKGDILEARLELETKIKDAEFRLVERIETGKTEVLKWLIGISLRNQLC